MQIPPVAPLLVKEGCPVAAGWFRHAAKSSERKIYQWESFPLQGERKIFEWEGFPLQWERKFFEGERFLLQGERKFWQAERKFFPSERKKLGFIREIRRKSVFLQ